MRRSVVSAAVFCLVLAAAVPPSEATESRSLRVLFIGNSLTRFHNLPRTVRELIQSDGTGRRVRVSRETQPGATLTRLWRARRIRRRIAAGDYTHVVLQGHSLRAVTRPRELRDYAHRFAELIDGTGAQVVLYTPWARTGHLDGVPPELSPPPILQRRIARVYEDLGADLDAEVAPVGPAFLRAAERAPAIVLRSNDGIHPTVAGTYLAACVLYRVLTGRDAAGLSYRPHGMAVETASRLQRIADASGRPPLTRPEAGRGAGSSTGDSPAPAPAGAGSAPSR